MARTKAIDPVLDERVLFPLSTTVAAVREDLHAQWLFLISLSDRYAAAITSLDRFDSSMSVELKLSSRVDFYSDIALILKL